MMLGHDRPLARRYAAWAEIFERAQPWQHPMHTVRESETT
jgi:hypothetical protein